MGGFLPYGRQTIEDDDIAAVVQALRGDFLTGGPAVDSFEAALAAEADVPHAVVCANGTAALHLAALALDLGPGDTVIVPSVTFLATANAARYVGAEVVFADVDAEDGLMHAPQLEEALLRAAAGGGRLKAVFPVHLAGQCADLGSLAGLAKSQGLALVEDACHALGTVYEGGAKVGACNHGDMTVFSFHPVKTVAMGEGGAITTRDGELARRLRMLRSHGMVRSGFRHPDLALDAAGQPNPWYYEMHEFGFNYRATDIQCALGLSQLTKLGRFVERRRALAEHYDALLTPLAPLVRPIRRRPGCRAAWHLYPVLIDFAAAGIPRADVMRRLSALGIGTQVHYLPVHLQPYYVERYGRQSLPGAEAYYARTLSLPLFPGMADSDPERVVAALRESLAV